MNVVGKVGSLITRGVYSVATPFHPFGGAVDIIVVEQEDGTYRTTPWYVRFGKFQGVLRGAERIVRIYANGVEAEFHMLLDNSGEAYFVREVESGGEDVDDEVSVRVSQVDTIDSGSNDENKFDESIEIGEKSGYSSYHYEDVEEVENVVSSSEDSNSEVVLLSVDGHVLTAPISMDERNTEDMQLSIPQFHLGPGEGSGQDFTANGDVWTEGLLCDLDSLTPKDTEIYGMGRNLEGAGDVMSRNDTFRSCVDFEEDDSKSVDLLYVESEELEGSRHSPQNSSSRNILMGQMADSQVVVIGTKDFQNKVSTESQLEDDQLNAHVGSSPKRPAVEEDCNLSKISEFQRSISSRTFEISLCGNILHAGMKCNTAEEAFEAHRISEDEFKASGAAIIKNNNLIVKYKGKYFTWDKVAYIIVGLAVFGLNFSEEPKDPIPIEHNEIPETREEQSGLSPSTSTGRWRLWPIPFRRVKSLRHTNSNTSSNEDIFLDSESFFQDPWPAHSPSSNSNYQSPHKQLLRTNVPTSEQIASLNLKDGQNIVAFSFSTRVLGKQQVDAHIYLWKWNAKIVISDVDGTITRSDVLGQVMHLVGKDWTQSGVARLFAAIKENGYQLLFLSARAIVQAYLTRSFLLNLKQDGRALPNGPVVISPDGLFPSLYREVIRRAPHEFKIACLEDIRALFPSDHNPFYAGFGNRDTDELTYRKIGIPKGKIFIINPKGEVAIYNCTDVKSYISLHTLVNDMFPPTSLAEQEDFNSWNYWKIPLPTID